MVKETELYNILQVDAKASHQEIHARYWTVVKSLEPAEVSDSKKLVEITEAYNILKEPALRRRYDVEGIKGITLTDNQGRISFISNVKRTVEYLCYDLSNGISSVTTLHQSPASENSPLIKKSLNSGCRSCCYKSFVWIAAIILFVFIFTALTYMLFLED